MNNFDMSNMINLGDNQPFKNIKALVLDAGPLITQSASSLQQHAQEFYTTPGVYGELKDENVRQQVLLWADNLKIRHPKQESIQKVTSFSKLTGDYAVLSVNDIHIISLAYELECELNKGDWRLRKYPGEKLEYVSRIKTGAEQKSSESIQPSQTESNQMEHDEKSPEERESQIPKKKNRRRGGKKQREKREAQLQKELNEIESESVTDDFVSVDNEDPQPVISNFDKPIVIETNMDSNTEEMYYSDSDGEWITPENFQEELLKDSNEQIQESSTVAKRAPFIKVALATGDFACQNVSMQIGLNLMNAMSGKQIKKVRNYMYRCHACFRLTPIPKNGKPKHFCPKCGGDTLLRCAVSIDNITGRITPHLKANFQWIKRGEKYTLPSPLSKNQQRIQGNGGYQHNKQNRHRTLQDPLILREDQKEYQKAVKDDEWQRRQNDKMLQEWIGGGSADNYISPFTTMQNIRPSGVKVGKSRYINSSKGKRK